MKKPEEIKKGLVETIEETAWVVEGGDAHDLQDACYMAHASMADALAYIQQLEDKNKQCHQETTEMYSEMCMLREKVHRLEAERDAAVNDLRHAVSHPHTAGVCYACKHHDNCQFQDDCDIMDNNHWEWRGVQEEE